MLSLFVLCSLSAMEQDELPSWKIRQQILLKNEIESLFSKVPLADISQLENEIIALGREQGINNWEKKFEQYKETLGLIGGQLKKYFKVEYLTHKDFFHFYYTIENLFPLLTVLGLKPVTAEEGVTHLSELENTFAQLERSIPLRYKFYDKTDNNSGKVRMYAQPLIPLSKLMEWYNAPQEWTTIKKKFFQIAEELKDEDAIKFYSKAHEIMKQMKNTNQQEVDLDFLGEWADWFEKTSNHPINQSALLLGYQPYAYNRSLYPDESRWEKFYDNQINYRFLLQPEFVYLDDTTPYVRLYGRLMEYTYRKALGDAFYVYILASTIFTFIKETQMQAAPDAQRALADAQEIDEFMKTYFKVRDLQGFNLDSLTLGHIAFFMSNFLEKNG